MKPILFDSAATTFTTNGIGRLDAISCAVREELNGLYELDMTYPVSGEWFSYLVVSNIIVAQPYDGAGPQPFRIYKVSKAMNGRVSVYARHTSYQLNWIPVMPFNFSSLADCLAKLKSQSVYTNPFTFSTDKTVTTGGSFDEPLPCRSCLGGVQGSVLQKYGGDYLWDNWTVNLLTRRGADNGVRIAYGKNLIDATQETNIENTYTGVCPYYKDDNETVTLTEKYISASTAANFPFLRVQTVDFTSDFEDPPTEAQLRTRTNTYITENNIGHPNVSIEVNFVALWQTDEYADIAPLERVQLGDTVTVHFDKLDIDEIARVEAYEYDVIRERYNTITIGDAKSSFAKTFVDQGSILETNIYDSLKKSKVYTDDIVEKNTAWLTNGQGYVVAVKNSDGSWKELLFMDTPSVTTAVKVLRINENGIGFSSTGVNGSYAQAWTLDGSLSLGGVNDAYGTLSLLSNAGKLTVKMDRTGLAVYDANGRQIAEFTQSGTYFDYYDSSGIKTSSTEIDGYGLVTQESVGNASAEIYPGGIEVADSDGTSSSLTGSLLTINTIRAKKYYGNGKEGYTGSYKFSDDTKLTVRGGIVTNIVEGSGDKYVTVTDFNNKVNDIYESIQNCIDAIEDMSGISRTITINSESETELEFENGMLVDWSQNPW